MRTLEHPELPGRTVRTDDRRARVMAESGWVDVPDTGDVDPPDPDGTVDVDD